MRVTFGFTLVELMVATAIAGVGGAMIAGTLVRQQRFYAASEKVLEVRAQLRDGADVLVEDIRGAAVSDFGLPLMSDTAIEMYATVATSIACAESTGNTVGLPPAKLASGHVLTSILSPPDSGDVAAVLNVFGGTPDSARWEMYPVTSFVSRSITSACPSSTGFTTSADSFTGSTGYLLTLATFPSPGLRAGAPIHFLRRVRYSFYKSSDGDWYLGYRKCGPSSCATIQPVSGPYTSYRGNPGTSGLSFRYYDVAGAQLSSAGVSNAVARVDIVLRALTDSAIVTVSPRNRLR
jgi:prepilin-type N-terminal cleavage/methylation domain-containing protein